MGVQQEKAIGRIDGTHTMSILPVQFIACRQAVRLDNASTPQVYDKHAAHTHVQQLRLLCCMGIRMPVARTC